MSTLLGEVILKVECDEPEGKILREIRPIRLNRDSLQLLFYKFRQFKTIIGEEFSGDFKQFCTLFLSQYGNTVEANGMFWVVDNFVGIFYMTDIRPGVDCIVHYSFFDRRHHGRINLIKAMLNYAYATLGFHRLTVKIPLYAKQSVMYFTEKYIGFKHEGRLQSAIRFDNKWFDVNIYGLTAEKFYAAEKLKGE